MNAKMKLGYEERQLSLGSIRAMSGGGCAQIDFFIVLHIVCLLFLADVISKSACRRVLHAYEKKINC